MSMSGKDFRLLLRRSLGFDDSTVVLEVDAVIDEVVKSHEPYPLDMIREILGTPNASS